jgi:hypothetical protein
MSSFHGTFVLQFEQEVKLTLPANWLRPDSNPDRFSRQSTELYRTQETFAHQQDEDYY